METCELKGPKTSTLQPGAYHAPPHAIAVRGGGTWRPYVTDFTVDDSAVVYRVYFLFLFSGFNEGGIKRLCVRLENKLCSEWPHIRWDYYTTHYTNIILVYNTNHARFYHQTKWIILWQNYANV